MKAHFFPRFAPTRCLWASIVAGLVFGLGYAPQGFAEDAPPAEPPAESVDQKQEQVFESPEAVYAVAQAAFNQADWLGFLACVAPDRREELIGEIAVTFASLAQLSDADERVAKLVEEYLPKGFDPVATMSSDNPRAEVIRLAKRMGHPEEFFVNAMALINDMSYGDAEEPAQIIALSEVTYGKDQSTAKANVTIKTPDSEELEPWSFKLHEGSWYLSMK